MFLVRNEKDAMVSNLDNHQISIMHLSYIQHFCKHRVATFSLKFHFWYTGYLISRKHLYYSYVMYNMTIAICIKTGIIS